MTKTNFTGLNSVRGALLCSALAAPALMPAAALAQDQAGPCSQLEQTAAEIDFEASELSEEEFNQVVQGNDPAQCETWLVQVQAEVEAGVEGQVAETEQARVRLQDEVVIEGRVIIDQEQPSVQVEEQAAEVTVGNTTPDVNVTEAPMDILIRQGAPRISLDMPQPTITIEQPAPEIIVTMPDPSVEVGNTRPQIEVRQAEPRVQVTMADPTVELDLYQAEDPENSPGIEISQRENQEGGAAAREPEVSMSRAEAQIIYQEGEQQQANVSVSRSEPSIRVEQSEPEIEVASSGEPQVNWSQTGEAQVTFQQSGDANDEASAGSMQTAQAQDGQNADAQAQTGEMQTAQAQSEAGGPAVRRDGYSGVDVQQVSATELDGATVYGVQGDEIGEIGELTLAEGEANSVIVDVGGFLGMGERRVEIPFSDLSLLQGEDNGDIRVYIDASEENLNNYPEAG